MNYSEKHKKISHAIDESLKKNIQNFIIYPFGENGLLTKHILNHEYFRQEIFIIDNYKSLANTDILNVSILAKINVKNYGILLTIDNNKNYNVVRNELLKYVSNDKIIDIFTEAVESRPKLSPRTSVGKYSYGPLCDHWLVESVGAFCSFADGTDVVENHPTQYISTSPFLYQGSENNKIYPMKYEDNYEQGWFFPGVKPRGFVPKLKKIIIGNDVWLGKNVIITNGANVGDGVIAAAGSIITKDVESYSVVAGSPARVIYSRYTESQINYLKKIAWWSWSDEKIRQHYDDFFINIDLFIELHSSSDES
jgi:acetyltransferase-like isoleucine patch superfamily enzyme